MVVDLFGSLKLTKKAAQRFHEIFTFTFTVSESTWKKHFVANDISFHCFFYLICDEWCWCITPPEPANFIIFWYWLAAAAAAAAPGAALFPINDRFGFQCEYDILLLPDIISHFFGLFYSSFSTFVLKMLFNKSVSCFEACSHAPAISHLKNKINSQFLFRSLYTVSSLNFLFLYFILVVVVNKRAHTVEFSISEFLICCNLHQKRNNFFH